MKEYLAHYAPFLESTPIPKETLIQRVRTHLNTTQGKGKSILQLLYMLRFREIWKNGRDEVILL